MLHFGTDGIRGRFGEFPFVDSDLTRLGQAVGTLLPYGGTVLLAKDTRFSGGAVENALTLGLRACGLSVVSLGTLPTPAMSFLVPRLGADLGIVISASHNPSSDNGLKFFERNGWKLSRDREATVEQAFRKPQHNFNRFFPIFPDISSRDAATLYTHFLKTRIAPGSLKGRKVLVDCAHGALSGFAASVFRSLGANVVSCFDQPDGFNINRGCGALDVEALKGLVPMHEADWGFAFDGDGDRCVLIDERGQAVHGDQLLAFLALHGKQLYGRRGVVGTVLSGLGLELFLESCGVPFRRAPVGDVHVARQLSELGWNIGGEPSGHFIVNRYGPTGDGLLIALLVSHILATQKKRPSQIFPLFEGMAQASRNVSSFYKEDLLKLPSVRRTLEAVACKMGTRGRVVLRPSGTENVVRVFVEGLDAAHVESCASHLCDVLTRGEEALRTGVDMRNTQSTLRINGGVAQVVRAAES